MKLGNFKSLLTPWKDLKDRYFILNRKGSRDRRTLAAYFFYFLLKIEPILLNLIITLQKIYLSNPPHSYSLESAVHVNEYKKAPDNLDFLHL